MTTKVAKISYPQKPREMDISRFPTLKEAWNYSAKTLTAINSRLNEELSEPDISIVVAGSYGRMEASQLSDLDFLILSQTNLGERRDSILEVIKRLAQDLGINLPNNEGVFSTTISIDDMLARMGSSEDSLESLAQRMLLLMETRPIYNERIYHSAIDQILRKYLDLVIEDPRKDPLVLLNDLIRYFRAICVNYHFNFWRQQEKWGLRNIKLKHSRIILYAGLLFLIVNSTKNRHNKFNYILSKIDHTPLEKLAHVFLDNQDFSFERILGKYEVFLRRMSDPEVREGLKIDYRDRYSNPHYMDLRVNAEGLQADLVRFLMSPRNLWADRIIGYLIF